MKSDLLGKFAEIKIFLFDLEGVLIKKEFLETDENENTLFEKLENGCNEFIELGSKFGIVTSRNGFLTSKIEREKKCVLLTGSIDKVKLVDELLAKLKIEYKDVFYIGDDLLDIPLLQKCGISSTPKDGRREVKRVVSFITKSNSGEVLQEIIDYLKESKKTN